MKVIVTPNPNGVVVSPNVTPVSVVPSMAVATGPRGPGTLPPALSGAFTAVTDAAIDTQIESNTLTLTGEGDEVWPIVARGAEVSVSGLPYATQTAAIDGDTVKLRLTSSSEYDDETTGTLYFPGLSAPWVVTTEAAAFDSLMTNLQSGASQLIAHPLEYGSMYQDRAGTTPVTEPGQQVGLVLDWGLTGKKPVLGPELVTNGDISNGATGWLSSGGVISAVGGALRVTSDGTSGNKTGYQTLSGLTVGTSYEARFSVIGQSEELPKSYRVGDGPSQNQRLDVAASGDGKAVFTAVNTSHTVSLTFFDNVGDAGRYVDWDNISVRELPGYHATAISDAARGVLREVDGVRYIEYNGVNTAYATPTLPAPGVDKAQVFAGVRHLGAGMIVETGNTDVTAGSIRAYNDNDQWDGSISGGSVFNRLVERVTATTLPPATDVLTILYDCIGSGDVGIQLNGVSQATTKIVSSLSGVSQFNAHPIYIGARTGVSGFFKGRHYATLGPIVRFSAANATTAQINAAEAYYTARIV